MALRKTMVGFGECIIMVEVCEAGELECPGPDSMYSRDLVGDLPYSGHTHTHTQEP